MAMVMVSGGGAAMASMIARLISKLSLCQEDELVDLGNLKRPGTGFIAPRLYLVGKLNFARVMQFDFLSKCSTSDVEVVNFSGDIMVVPLHFFWIWVEVCDLSATLTTDATIQLIGKTIGLVLNIDQSGLMKGSTRVSVTLPLNNLVRIDRCLHVSPEDVINVQYMYESLMVPNLPTLFKEKRLVQIREVSPFPSSIKVTGVRRSCEEDETDGGKRLRHSLAMMPLGLNSKDLGFSLVVSGELGITKTGKFSKKRGRPRGSKNKKRLFAGELSSSMADTATQEPNSTEETGGE
ncbi:hypothetical protein ACLB2K_047635 [Fragaria x ananassa]